MTRTIARHRPRPGPRRRAGLAGTLALAALVTGCGNVHHVEVGSIPDDYRTRHPINVAEAPVSHEIPITSGDTRLSLANRGRVEDAADAFRESGASTLRVLLPSGSRNARAAKTLSDDIVAAIRGRDVARSQIFVQPYSAVNAAPSPPVRLVYATLKAEVHPCGRWPEDLGNTHENKNYYNFGCATQQNLAAQIADPSDLLAPRGSDPIDADRRTTVLGDYRAGDDTASDGGGDIGLNFGG